jgi:hypothetical protein
MNRAAAVLCLFLCVAIAADSVFTRAFAQSSQSGIVLVQDRQQGPGIFRFLFRNERRRQEQPQILRRLTPREEREELRPRAREAARPRQEREAARPRREKREAARPRREKREAARSRGEEGAQQPQRKRRERRPAAPIPREVVAVEKAENAKRVLVLGDFMAGALSKGLTEAYTENPNIMVIDGTNGSSGLVRADLYDWPGQIPALMEAHKPDALLMIVGANDRQSIATEAGAQALGSDGWRAAYAARVATLADALKATGKPVLWGGLAPVRPSAMSRDYSALNDIVREQLEAKGLRFVETWNGFADEEGRFVASGPDVGGQNVQLRDSDGLNFTRAGQRKLAFFVEQELTGLLGAGAPQVAAVDPALADPGLADPSLDNPANAGPRIGPMVPIEALSTGGDALSAAPAAEPSSGAVVTTISKRLAGEGAATPPNGRVDAYAWPAAPPVVTPAAAAPSVLPPPPVLPLTGAPPGLPLPLLAPHWCRRGPVATQRGRAVSPIRNSSTARAA